MPYATEIASLWIIAILTCVAATSGASAQPPAQHVRHATLSLSEATRLLLEQFPNGQVLEIEQDTERGRTVFEAEVRDREGVKHEVVLDAEDGHILHNEVDDD